MKIEKTNIFGVFKLENFNASDNRGKFVKTFNSRLFEDFGLRIDWHEEFYSMSEKNVLRGMHFQTPPHQHAKMVYCLSGAALDVIFDMRMGSPSYGETYSFVLNGDDNYSIYMPEGVAHGFLSLTEKCIMQYKVTSTHSPQHDCGINWASIGFNWPSIEPVVSERDQKHPAFSEFVNPFKI